MDFGVWRSLVSRLVRVQEASGSNPDTPTKNPESAFAGSGFFISEYPVLNSISLRILLRGDGMGYRIAYQSTYKKSAGKRFGKRLPVLILLCFVLFLFMVEKNWQDGEAFLKKVGILPGEVIPVSALNCFAEELGYGKSLLNSFVHFCNRILS